MATRGTPGGSTLSRYCCGCVSNSLGAGHRHYAHLAAGLGEALRGIDREPDLRTGRDQDAVGLAAAVDQHVAAASRCPRPAPRVRSIGGSAWRLRIRLVGPSRRSTAAAQATAVSTVSQGRHSRMFGIMPQARHVLHRLVRRAVLAEADRVVRVDEDHALLHQRRHAHGVARVVGEHQERAAVRDESAVQRDAVHDRGHAELAHAVVQVVAADVVAGNGLRPLVVRVVRAGQVGRSAEHLGNRGAEHVEHLLRRRTRRQGRGLFLRGRDELLDRLAPAGRQLALQRDARTRRRAPGTPAR